MSGVSAIIFVTTVLDLTAQKVPVLYIIPSIICSGIISSSSLYMGIATRMTTFKLSKQSRSQHCGRR